MDEALSSVYECVLESHRTRALSRVRWNSPSYTPNRDVPVDTSSRERACWLGRQARAALALATVDLSFEEAGPYWGAASRISLVRSDLRSAVTELLAAVAASDGGRAHLCDAAKTWTPRDAAPDEVQSTTPGLDGGEVEVFVAPDVGEATRHTRALWPFVRVRGQRLHAAYE